MNDKPQNSKRARAVPTGRLSRLGSIGSLATGIAGGMLMEGARQLKPEIPCIGQDGIPVRDELELTLDL